MRGVILANASADGLEPMTRVMPRALLPVFDKPLIYYPLSLFMRAGIREVSVLARSSARHAIARVLGDGSQWGMRIEHGFRAVANERVASLDVGTILVGPELDARLRDALDRVPMRGFFRLLELIERDGLALLDVSDPDGLIEAATFVRMTQESYGCLVASPEEIAYRRGWIDDEGLLRAIAALGKTEYASALEELLRT